MCIITENVKNPSRTARGKIKLDSRFKKTYIKRNVSVTLSALPIEKQIYAKTLLDMGLSLRKTMRKTGLSPHTVIAIKRSQAYSPQILEEFKRRLPYKSYKLADDVMDCITPAEIIKAPLGTKMMAFGVAIDKARDMEGSNRPVFNIVSIVNETKTMMDKLAVSIAMTENVMGAS